MTQDEIIRMAREAGMEFVTTNSYSTRNKYVTHLYQNMYGIEKMERFAAIVAADLFTYDQVKAHIQAAVISEREACAKVCEEIDVAAFGSNRPAPNDCAAAIRARGEK